MKDHETGGSEAPPGPADHCHLPRTRITWMGREHLPHVLRIEGESFASPWSEEDFLRELRRRQVAGLAALVKCPGGEQAVGYLVYERERRAVRVLNLAVDARVRRLGAATALLATLASKMERHQRWRVLAHVRESNTGAQLFLKAMDFRALRVDRGFYLDTGEDGYEFEYRVRAAACAT